MEAIGGTRTRAAISSISQNPNATGMTFDIPCVVAEVG
jgi:hypothetical protein